MHAISSEKQIEGKTRRALSEIFAGCSLDKVGVRLWNGTAWPDHRPRPTVLALKHPEALGRMFLPGTEVGLAEAYVHNDFDIEGDIEAAFEVGDFLLSRLGDWKKKLKIAGLLMALPGRNGRSTIERASSMGFSASSPCGLRRPNCGQGSAASRTHQSGTVVR